MALNNLCIRKRWKQNQNIVFVQWWIEYYQVKHFPLSVWIMCFKIAVNIEIELLSLIGIKWPIICYFHAITMHVFLKENNDSLPKNIKLRNEWTRLIIDFLDEIFTA